MVLSVYGVEVLDNIKHHFFVCKIEYNSREIHSGRLRKVYYAILFVETQFHIYAR